MKTCVCLFIITKKNLKSIYLNPQDWKPFFNYLGREDFTVCIFFKQISSFNTLNTRLHLFIPDYYLSTFGKTSEQQLKRNSWLKF